MGRSTDVNIERLKSVFQDYVTAYSSVARIERYFDVHGFTPDAAHQPKVSGARRGTAEQHFVNMDFDNPRILGRFIQVVEEAILDAIAYQGYSQEHSSSIEFRRLSQALERLGFQWTGERIESSAGSRLTADLKTVSDTLSPGAVDDYVRRMTEAVESDPELAIGTAKELVEATCKFVLRERQVPHPENLKLTKLCALTFEQLELLPKGVRKEKKGSDSIKRVLGSLSQIVQGVAELRNDYGTGHGRPQDKTRGIHPRHARLAVGTASTLAHFLLETHDFKK